MTDKNKKYKTILTIAGFDGSGGAGIQADLKTFAALGCYGLSVLTALPIQNTLGVQSIYPIEKQCIVDQLKSVLEDFEIDAIKIGMLHTKEVIECVSKTLKSYSLPIVLDPVMVATSGNALISDTAILTMIETLFPIVTLLTPNLNEASKILGKKIQDRTDMESAALELCGLGPKAVIVKGGHSMNTTCDDCLCLPNETVNFHWYSSKRILTKNLHGTGCTFSSAITAFLARGHNIVEATRLAKQFLYNAIEAGASYKLGHGQGPLHHFFSIGCKSC